MIRTEDRRIHTTGGRHCDNISAYVAADRDDFGSVDMIRQHIVFRGWVQGVGFRYRARHAADMYGATGWVRNDPDGSVAMEIQGTQEQIDKVIMAVQNGTYIRIEHMDVKAIPLKEGERGFRTMGW